MTDEQKREHFRVEYPLRYSPTVTVNGRKYDVRDVSERGIAFKAENSDSFKLGDRVMIGIEFADGETFSCFGEIIRTPKKLVVIHLAKGIPLDKIRTEQIQLIKRSRS